MAVHVVLDRDQVRSILSLYHLDALEDFGGIAEGSLNTAYWVRSGGEDFFLRITENKRVQDMVFEKDLLMALRKGGLHVPELLENVAGGTFTPWSSGGRFVSLFRFMPGRELGAFEVRPQHVLQVARFAGEMHEALQGFVPRRNNEFSREKLLGKMSELLAAVAAGRLDPRFQADLSQLWGELETQARRSVAHLPQGTVHGDSVRRQREVRGRRARGDHRLRDGRQRAADWELAVFITAWCWEPSAEQRGGPAGEFDLERARAAIEGYSSARALEPEEMEALAAELRLAAARFAITRLYDFELNPLPPDRRVYKDYRHFLARLSALSDGRAEQLVAAIVR